MNRLPLTLISLLAVLAGSLVMGPEAVSAKEFVVDIPADDGNAHDKSPGDGFCADAYDACTLRAAIEEANAYPGDDSVSFAYEMYIQLDTTVGALPSISDRLRIDASSVWNTTSNKPGVTHKRQNQSFPALITLADHCEVYGLCLINFTDAVLIQSAYNTIGGPQLGQRNVISSNAGYGVAMHGPAVHHNLVWGNWIGLSITGDTKQPNWAGVGISGGAQQNTIGGDFLGEGNVISGNTHHGVGILGLNSDSNRLGANLIGLPAVGSSLGVGNGGVGVYVYDGAQYNLIGGSTGGLSGNFIAMNGNSGVSLSSAHYNFVESNIIAGNARDGVYVSDAAGNLIQSNEITQNSQRGVFVRGATATGNAIMANSIHRNGYKGIYLFDGGNLQLAAPTINIAIPLGAAGIGCAGCLIHVYSDTEDEGEVYQGFAYADANGNWSYAGPLSGPNVTATNTDAGANTSEFSAPYGIWSNMVYLPAVVRSR